MDKLMATGQLTDEHWFMKMKTDDSPENLRNDREPWVKHGSPTYQSPDHRQSIPRQYTVNPFFPGLRVVFIRPYIPSVMDINRIRFSPFH